MPPGARGGPGGARGVPRGYPWVPQGPPGGPWGPRGTPWDPRGTPRAPPGFHRAPRGNPRGSQTNFQLFFHQFSTTFGTILARSPKRQRFFMKTKVVDLKKLCRTHLLINSGDHFLTISWNPINFHDLGRGGRRRRRPMPGYPHPNPNAPRKKTRREAGILTETIW